MRYRLTLLLTIIIFSSSITWAQQDPMAEALYLFENNRYEEAIERFNHIDTPLARLFIAKSWYALGDFRTSLRLSESISKSVSGVIASEAQYLNALNHFQQKNFGPALELLHTLKTDPDISISNESQQFYNALLAYLSWNQRMELVSKVRNSEIKTDIVTGYFERYHRDIAVQLVEQLRRYDRTSIHNDLLRSAQRLSNEVNLNFQATYPDGLIIDIGVLLPAFDNKPSDKSVSRGLYNGVLLAVDEFNRNNGNRKVRIHFIDSDKISGGLGSNITRLKQELSLDVIIGPLYSEQVEQLSSVTERMGIPILPPLANTFRLSARNTMIYQINPSFAARGRKTAQIAMENLGLNKFAVVSEKGTHGEMDAKAFIEQIQSAGGTISRYFNEDFASNGYFVGDITPWLANNQALVDSTVIVIDTVDAVYLPYTGEVAGTLLNLTLTGLEAYQPDYIILGNDEMMYIEHSGDRLRRLNLMYTTSSFLRESNQDAINFRYDYVNRSGVDPSSFSYLGYDIGKYFLNAVDQLGNPDDFWIWYTSIQPFHGMATSIVLGEDRSNEALNLFRVSSNRFDQIPLD